jgi:hypothetical protein
MTNYSLAVVNNSTEFQDICVYQKPGDLGVASAHVIAWLAAPAWPNTTVDFEWSPEYCFVWSQTGQLSPGTTVQASEIVPADPGDRAANQTVLDYDQGAFRFVAGDAVDDPELGSLYIREGSTVPPGRASVGIGMSGRPTFLVDAEPNMRVAFTPHPGYWVTAGSFKSGQVLDLEAITNEAQVPFDVTRAMQAVLGPTNTWEVSPAPE